ncbi:hypothetical protein L4174_009555 [Photobacterium sp. CCB-ST2H9]|uniref:hypothetical protein n=1 Tax=Photobacterium sp. CCB-ST2H9 TaxID=2912855 RepID=UPI002003A979|nr:hypothetical protein [Photobacterium sp. CCB-ST2H9]UTM56095.1 hypothetical protein L4174_009555 [Photobacterium sp. CCB-ST2H9]
MRRKSVRTMWIAVLTALALVVSGVANSTSVMTFSMIRDVMNNDAMISDSVSSEHNPCAQMSHNSHADHQSVAQQPEAGCSHDQSMHTCCTAACGTATVLPSYHSFSSLQSRFAVRPAEPVVAAVHTAQSLFRPPIA